MSDVMEQLRAARPMPRGERLATAVSRGRSPNEDYKPRVMRHAERTWMKWWRRSYTLNVFRHDIRAHAAPLALARERRRRERAEARLCMCEDRCESQARMMLAAQDATWAEVLRLRAELRAVKADAEDEAGMLRAELARLRAAVPTREEVEKAVDALLEAPEKFGDMDAARAALVVLATRGRE